MSHVLVIASREIRERKFVFASAGIAALLSIASTLLPDARGWGRGQVMMLTGSILSIAFALSLAIILGTSVVGRELTNRRMSFYFARPVSAAAIWFGKVIGALVTIAVCALIPLLPGLAAGGLEWTRTSWATPFQAAGVVAVLALMVFLFMHAASTMTRSRSALLVLDVVLLGIAIALGWIIVRPLVLVFALETAVAVGFAILTLVALAMIAGGVWQLARGRADIRANHFELSKWTWAAVFLMLTVAAVFVAWVRSPAPGDLRYSEIEQTAGDWIALTGARTDFDYNTTILLNTRTGELERVSPFDAMLSGDGSTAVWMERDRADTTVRPLRLMRMNLAGKRRRIDTGLTLPPFGQHVLSDDGSRIASFRAGTMSVHDLLTGRLVGSARVTPDHGAHGQIRFVGPQLVRIYLRRVAGGNSSMSVFEYDTANRSLVRTVSDRATTRTQARFSADGGSLIEYGGKSTGEKNLAVLDARTLVPVATLEGANPRGRVSTAFLRDGRIASVVNGGIRLFAPSGQILRDIPLEMKGEIAVVSEAADRKLVVSEGYGVHPNRRWTVMIVDVERGVVERNEAGFVPVGWITDPRASMVLLARGENEIWNEIWRWDVKTGEKKRLFAFSTPAIR